MSNTYFRIQKEVDHSSYKNNYELSLTAFCGNIDMGNIQLTVRTNSTMPSQSGIGYITLNDKEVDLLIAGLLERKLGRISATSNEQSIFSPNDDE